MKAITIRQPWASLIAAGVKTIETRPRRTAYRGRIAIHAARAEWWPQGYTVGTWRCFRAGGGRNPQPARAYDRSGLVDLRMPLPLGAVVASAVLTDCVPIVDTSDVLDPEHVPPHRLVAWDSDAGLYLIEPAGQTEPAYRSSRCIEDQLPFGDVSPGRWALLLDDIAPTTERCPWCWGYNAWPETCDVCGRAGRCDPVPAKGQQAVPWEWTP